MFTKNEGSLGTTGAVAWLFERRGIVMVDADRTDEDSVMLAAAEGGADDVTQDGDSFEVTTSPEALTLGPGSARAGRDRGRVGRDDDGAEDDDRA